MAATASAATSGGVLTVTVTDTNGNQTYYVYPATPPDARSAAQWQTDCQNAALGIINAPSLGDGGPDAAAALASIDQTG